MAEPFFSIIVPAYDVEPAHLEECIASLLSQTFDDFEIVVVDDGSVGETRALLAQIERVDERVRVIRIPHSGVSVARNVGMDEARGTYLLFVDADDLLMADALERIKEEASDESDMLWFGFRYMSDGGRVCKEDGLRAMRYASASDAVADWIRNDTLPISACNKAFRRKPLAEKGIRFREGVGFGEDRLFNFDVLEHCARVMVMADNLYVYRISDGSASHRFVPGMLAVMLEIHEARMDALMPLYAKSADEAARAAFAEADYAKSVKKAWLHFAEYYRGLSREQRRRELDQYLALDASLGVQRRRATSRSQRLLQAAIRQAARTRSQMPLKVMMLATTLSRRG